MAFSNKFIHVTKKKNSALRYWWQTPDSIVLALMSFKMYGNSNFDQVFVEKSENTRTAFPIKFVLEAYMKIVLLKIFIFSVFITTQLL